MKKVFLGMIMIAAFTACNSKTKGKPDAQVNASAEADTANYTTIQWADTAKNFGTINQGEKIEIKYTFTNTGNKPLFVTNVQPGCGCTTSSFSKEAIAPGGEGWVTAAFDSKNFSGEVHKSVRVKTNTKNSVEHLLTFTGNITGGTEEKKRFAKPAGEVLVPEK